MTTSLKSPDRSALNWLLVGGSLVSLFLWASLEDPFNAPKSWILFSVGLWLLGWVAFQAKAHFENFVDRWVLILTGLFAFSLLIAFIATDVKLQGLFGDYARRTGFLSYFSLIIFFVAASFLFNLSNIALFDRVTLVVGFFIGFYGFLQHFKFDVIKWNNPYNSVLSTLGNPDFAAAVMAIFLVLAFGLIINGSKPGWVRGWASANVVILFVTIVFSQVRQGLLAGALGVGVVVIVWIHQRQKFAAWLLVGLSVLVGGLGLVGMLNHGPLRSYFYKISVTYRGDYWRAGIRMFKTHPWFGVGLDRYGAYFREYRDLTQVLRRGPLIISNAAHDVPIQLAATGGIFVLTAFLAIKLFIFWRGVVALRNSTGVKQITVATFFGAWITYEAQSLISIDNLGIAIWGWILGGLVIALSKDEILKAIQVKTPSKSRSNKPEKINSSGSLAQPMVSGLLFVVGISLSIPMFLSDSSLKTLRSYAPPSASLKDVYFQAARKPLQFGFQDGHIKTSVASLLARAGAISEAKADLNAVIARDPKAIEAIESAAVIDEETKNFAEAIQYRRKISVLDPLNYINLLQLGEDMKASGDIAGAKSMITKIDSFAPQSDASRTAHKDFGRL